MEVFKQLPSGVEMLREGCCDRWEVKPGRPGIFQSFLETVFSNDRNDSLWEAQ